MCWFFQSSAEVEASSSSTSSSIGKNSDLWGTETESSDSEDSKEENEVQSAYKGKLNAIDALEEALPIRRGISDFYNGRSKSFLCLATASSFSSIKDIGKPEDAYTRERRNRLAHQIWSKNLRDRCGISKRPVSPKPGRAALSRSSSISSTNSNSNSNSCSNSKFPPHLNLRSRASHNNLAVLSSLQPSQKSLSLPDLHRHSMLDEINH